MRPRPIAIVAGVLLTVITALIGAAAWLLGTESGFARVVGLAGELPGVRIAVRGARGTLAGGFEVDELVVDHERVQIVAHALRGRLDPVGLPLLRVRLPALAAQDVTVAVKRASRPPSEAPVTFLPGPMRLVVDELRVATLDIRAPAGGRAQFADVAAELALARSRIAAPQLRFAVGPCLVDGRATLLAGDPLGLDADLAFTVPAGAPRVSGTATLAGTLAALAVKAELAAPRGARFAGTVALLDAQRLAGQLVLERFDPGALGLASGEVTGTLEVTGSVEEFAIGGHVAAARLPFGRVAIRVAGGYERDTLKVTQLAVAAAGTSGAPAVNLTAAGRIDFGAQPRIELGGSWTGMRWPGAGGAALLTSPNGTFRIGGSGPFEYQLSAALGGARLPPASLTARGTVGRAQLVVESFDATLAAGSASGRATLGFSAARPWTVALSGRGIDPGAFREPLKGRVSFDVTAEGEGFGAFGHWDARLEHLDGRVRGLAARGGGAIKVRGETIGFDAVKLAFGSATLDANGTLGAGAAFSWQLRVDRLGDFLDGAAGSIRSRGTLSGDLAHLAAQGTLEASDPGFGSWRAAAIRAEAKLDATDRERSFVRLVAQNPRYGAHQADQLRVLLDGKASEHTLNVLLTSGAESAELATRGAYRGGAWTVQLESLRVSGPPLLAYRLEAPSTLVLSREATTLTKACLVRDESRVCAQGSWSDGRPWAATLDAEALPLRLAAIAMPKDTGYDGALFAKVGLRGAPGQPWTGESALRLADAEFRYRAATGRMERIRLDRASASLEADPRAFSGRIELSTVAGSTATAAARIARDDGPLAQAPLSGTLSLSTAELAALPMFIPGVDRLAGHLEADVRISGTAAAPLVGGSARLTGGEIDAHRTNLLLRDIDARLAIEDDEMTLAASAATRGGSASAAGRFRWHDRAVAGELDFKGERLLVADLPEVRIVASPQLHFAVDRNRITVRGDVTIPSARIAPRDLRGAVIASGDERIVTEQAPEKQSALAVEAAVRLVLGDDVSIDAYGLKGKLGGNLLVAAREGEAASGSGELNVREGTYTAYTRQFDIERGRLLFAGQTLGDPGIDVRAQRRIDTTIAGINVRGTLLKPQTTFYSEPPMSQQQIAAMLILGVTLDDLQDQTKTTGTTTPGMSVSLGKFLTPRLYVSYGVSLTESINTLKLRYTIGDRWVIRTESGVQQSVDIEYSIAR